MASALVESARASTSSRLSHRESRLALAEYAAADADLLRHLLDLLGLDDATLNDEFNSPMRPNVHCYNGTYAGDDPLPCR